MSQEIVGAAASNVGIGGGAVGGTVLTLSLWVIGFGTIFFLGYMAWYFIRNKYHATIYTYTGSGVEKHKDKFRIVRDPHNKSIQVAKMLKHKEDYQGEIPKSSFIREKKLFGYKITVDFYEDEKGRLQVIEPIKTGDTVKFRGIDSANQKWAVLKTKELADRYSNVTWWEKNGTTIMIASLIVITLVVMIVMVRELGSFTDATTQGLQTVANAMRDVAASQSAPTQFIEGTGGGS